MSPAPSLESYLQDVQIPLGRNARGTKRVYTLLSLKDVQLSIGSYGGEVDLIGESTRTSTAAGDAGNDRGGADEQTGRSTARALAWAVLVGSALVILGVAARRRHELPVGPRANWQGPLRDGD